jgi:hypothetical protein
VQTKITYAHYALPTLLSSYFSIFFIGETASSTDSIDTGKSADIILVLAPTCAR